MNTSLFAYKQTKLLELPVLHKLIKYIWEFTHKYYSVWIRTAHISKSVTPMIAHTKGNFPTG